MEHKLLGTIVVWNGEKWYVDNTDENFKDESEETALFLLPEKYADAEENSKLMCSGNPDIVGYWVYESKIEAVIVEQECESCGKHFQLKYCSDGTYEYLGEVCECEGEFHPVGNELTISEWLSERK